MHECNEMLVKSYQKLARNSLASCTQAKKVHARKGNHHEPWFTAELLREKQRVNKHNRWLSKHPEDSQLRAKLFQLKKDYKKHLRRKKEEFIKRVNKEIEEGKNISWGGFKKLKSYCQHPNSLDLYDMTNFINFFKCLYSTVPETGLTDDELLINPDIRRDVSSCLNKDITLDELEVCLIRLKNNKAVSEDLICNEFLKNSSQTLCQAILKVFNECLNHGTCPWNTSYVTPLHKKGSI